MYFLQSHLKTRETMPRPRITVSRGSNRRATLRASLGIWASTFFRSWQMLLWPDLAHPTRCTRLGPLKRPCHWPLGGLQCTNRALPSSLGTCHIRSGRLKPIQTPQGAGHRPSKTQPYCNSSMSVYGCISVYVCIYVCIYDLAYVEVSICLYMYVYACICVYARIYSQKGHIHQKWVWLTQPYWHSGRGHHLSPWRRVFETWKLERRFASFWIPFCEWNSGTAFLSLPLIS